MNGSTTAAKAIRVRELLAPLGSVVVAFSGGVDSSLLLALAMEQLGAERVLAVTVAGVVVTEEELAEAVALAASQRVEHRVVRTNELEIAGFAENPPERCYLCRREMCVLLYSAGAEWGGTKVVDGANADDLSDFRPGLRAAAELGVRHPLAEAGLTKAEIREMARSLGLRTWNRPASPCLASRFPYGERITPEGLRMVSTAEALLSRRGFPVVRVRHHGLVARIEVPADRVAELAAEPLREQLSAELRGLGYSYVCADLQGFRSGSLNETLGAETKDTLTEF